VRKIDGFWPVLFSSSENPLRILLELIWAKLEIRFRTRLPMDDSIEMERLSPFVVAKFGNYDGKEAWLLDGISLSKEKLQEKKARDPDKWEPNIVNMNHLTIINAIYEAGSVLLSDDTLENIAKENGFELSDEIDELIGMGIVFPTGAGAVTLAESEFIFTPGDDDNFYVAPESKSDLFSIWLNKKDKIGSLD
jgi:hypothetical protein